MSLLLRSWVAAAICLPLVALTGCGDKTAPTAGAGAPGGRPGSARTPQVVEVVSLARRDLQETLNLVGTLAANESAEIRPEIGGLVRQIFFDEGQPVKKGEVMLKIDDSELQAQFAQVDARYNLAKLNVERSSNLSESRTISQSAYDQARSEFSSAEAERSLLQLRIQKTEVKSPFDGIAGSRVISPGDYVTPSSVITTVNDLSHMKIGFQVPERYLAKVKPGSIVRAMIRSETSGEETGIDGKVYFVSSTIDRASRASEVKALLDQPPATLRPGMFANVTLVLEERKSVLTVPEGAILADARGVQIILVGEKDGAKVAQFVPVRTGLRTRGIVEVAPLQGDIAEGAQVVASGVGALILFPGAPLDPKPLRDQFSVAQ